MFKTFKTSIKNEIDLTKLVDYILLNGLHESSIDFLKEFTMFKDENMMKEISFKII